MYALTSLLGSIYQSYGASGQAASAANTQAMSALANSQMAYMQSAMQAQSSAPSQGLYVNAGSQRLLEVESLRNFVQADHAPVAEKNWAEAVQPSEHELELMRWDENLAALKKKTAEIQAEVKARVFARTD